MRPLFRFWALRHSHAALETCKLNVNTLVVTGFTLEDRDGITLLRLNSSDSTNRLTRACVLALTDALAALRSARSRAIVITGSEHFFSAGADLNEIHELTGPAAYDFALMGQRLMNIIASFPVPTIAAIRGYCMGGGLDLALACHRRFAHPHAVFGHRGAALGLITGWGGTQRLPRLIGKGRALQMFVAAEKIAAAEALRIGLIDCLCDDPVEYVHEQLARGR